MDEKRTGKDRREGADRRKAQVDYPGPDRRREDRRTGKDRRDTSR
ncbi:MAG: hypothetical protein WBF17_20115 [Phycisphaerae bacterium]